MKKERNEELQSRREFFKKAAKGVLPILGSLSILTQFIPTKLMAKEQMGCGWTCFGSCMTGCLYSCGGTCVNGCYMSCMSACGVSCGNSCSGGCNDSCAWGCSSCVAECRIGCGQGCSNSCIAECSSYSKNTTYSSSNSIYSSGTSNTSNSSSSSSSSRAQKTCNLCKGKGRIIETDGLSFGLSSTKWCDECEKNVPVSHYHTVCPSCKGKGKW